MGDTRRNFLKTVGLGVGASMLRPALGFSSSLRAGESPAGAGPVPGKPDILVLMTDQWNPRNLGYERDPDVHTPNLDALASQSTNIANCYTHCPVCMPARTCLISGLYPHNTGLWGNSTDFFIPPILTPLFSDMRQVGYRTSQIGKFHWHAGGLYRREYDSLDNYYHGMGIDHPVPIPEPYATQGRGLYQDYLRKIGKYDAYRADMEERLAKNQYLVRPSVVPPNQYNDWIVADQAVEFIEGQPADKPYFLIASFPSPHPPLDAMGRYETLYDPRKMHLAGNVKVVEHYENNTFDLDSIRKMRANYLGKMTLVDDCIGRVISTVKARGSWDNTLVFFIADHGEMMGAHGAMSKTVFWEESGRVPMLIKPPGPARPGRRVEALAQMQDVYGTSVAAAGGKMSRFSFSTSLLPLVDGAKEQVQEAVFSEIRRGQHRNFMVRHGRYKWFRQDGKEALFDLANDPLEMENLVASPAHRGVVAESKDRLNEMVLSRVVDYSAGYKPLVQRMREGHPEDDSEM